MTQPLRLTHYPIQPGLSLTASLSEKSDRCGIYVLHFEDGSFYVGQAHDVTVRFAWHLRHWPVRISGISFGPVEAAALDDVERAMIQHHERNGHRLRNTSLVGLPQGDTAFDIVVSQAEQSEWLTGDVEPSIGERGLIARQRLRTRSKFEQLAAHPLYPEIRTALADYLYSVVPAPHETERRFWSLTSMPSTNRAKGHQRLTALSLNNVEGLVFFEEQDEEGPFVMGFINLSPIGTIDLSGFPDVHLDEDGKGYRTTGPVRRIYFEDPLTVLDLIGQPDICQAARRFALGLVRKGSGMFARFHDYHLSDDVFAAIQEALETEEDVTEGPGASHTVIKE